MNMWTSTAVHSWISLSARIAKAYSCKARANWMLELGNWHSTGFTWLPPGHWDSDVISNSWVCYIGVLFITFISELSSFSHANICQEAEILRWYMCLLASWARAHRHWHQFSLGSKAECHSRSIFLCRMKNNFKNTLQNTWNYLLSLFTSAWRITWYYDLMV